MNEFARRTNDIADDNPQKVSFRTELNITADRIFRVLRAHNVVLSLAILRQKVYEFIARLQNKGFFTSTRTLASDFQTQLKGLVVSNSCEQWVLELGQAARSIEEHTKAETVIKVFGWMIGVNANAESNYCTNVLLPIEGRIQTALAEAQRELAEAQRKLSEAQSLIDEEVQLPNHNNRRRRLSSDSSQSERPSKVMRL